MGTGSYLPPKVVTNDDLARSLDTSDEWIHSHTGIHSRHIAEAEDCTSTMAVKAARKAMESANVTPEEIGLIIVATSTPDYNTVPATACLVQNEPFTAATASSFDGFLIGGGQSQESTAGVSASPVYSFSAYSMVILGEETVLGAIV